MVASVAGCGYCHAGFGWCEGYGVVTVTGMEDVSLGARLARIRADVERSRRDARAAARMQERAEGIRARGVSRGREVRVEVDVAGRLVGITFLPASEGLSLRGLSEAVMAALADARRRATEQVRLVVDETLGADSDLGRQVLESYQQDTAGGGAGGGAASSGPGGGASGGRPAWGVAPMPVRPAGWDGPGGSGRR